jgi:hypothetical protein
VSERYPGGIITKSPTTPTGPYATGAAPGVWTLDQQLQYQQQGVWPTANYYAPYISTWYNLYNSPNYSAALIGTDLYTAGVRASGGSGNAGLTIAKYDAQGNQSGFEKASNSQIAAGGMITTDASGNLYLVGTEGSSIYIYKAVASTFTYTWARYISSFDSVEYPCAAVDSSGNVFIFAGVYTNCVYTGYIAKFNSSGTLQWQKYTPFKNGTYKNIKTDNSGNVYIVGGVDTGTGYGQATIAKLDTNGNVSWSKTINIGNASITGQFSALAIEPNGANVYASGFLTTGNNLLGIAKYNSSGTRQWVRTFGGSDPMSFTPSIAIDSNSNVYAAATYGFNYILSMVKYNSSGTIQWQRSLTGASSYRMYSTSAVMTDIDRPLFIADSYPAGSSSLSKIVSIKTPTGGTGTGTYYVGGVNYTYATTSLTDSTPTVSEVSGYVTVSTASKSVVTPAAVTFSDTFNTYDKVNLT